MKAVSTFSLILFLLSSSLYPQVTNSKKLKISKRVSKYVITASVAVDYAFSHNSDVLTYSETSDPRTGKSYFNSSTYALQSGFGIFTEGKIAVDKRYKFRLTGNLGYNHFYNTKNGGTNRTRWQIINAGPGIEYNFKPKSRTSSYIGAELLYTLMWGAWQTDITYPDGWKSNIYVRFRPAHRFGAALKMGMEFKMLKTTNFVVGLRLVWANIAPKQNDYSITAYKTYINDSESAGGITLGNPKQVVFMQLLSGINFRLGK